MKLYHFPSPNPQKVTFALLELGLDCEKIPVDLAKGEQRETAFLAINPFGRVPVLVDGELTLWESHAIVAYLGETTGRLWPATAAGRGERPRPPNAPGNGSFLTRRWREPDSNHRSRPCERSLGCCRRGTPDR